MTIYRGYDVIQSGAGDTFEWIDENDQLHTGYEKEDHALDAIDAHLREKRAA